MKGSRFLPAAVVLVVLLALSVGLSQAQGPAPSSDGQPLVLASTMFTYQGQLQKDGNPINATCVMTFTLYDDAAAGSAVGSPINASVAVNNGLFTVALDYGRAFTGDARWLEVAVLCPGDAGASTLSPRQELTATPYATSLTPGALVMGTLASGPVLAAYNNATTGASSHGVYGRSDSTSTEAAGVSGRSGATSGYAYGVRGEADSPIGAGVCGVNNATSGNAYGVRGISNSPTGRGVYGDAEDADGANYGVYGVTLSSAGYGVYGWARATTGSNYGVWGSSDSTAGIGVRGYATATSGTTYGVAGRTDSPEGQALRGLAAATTGSPVGVYGESDGTDGRGVVGYAPATTGLGRGVYGRSNSTEGYGVYGNATAGGGYTAGVYGTAVSSLGSGVAGNSANGSGVSGSTTSGIGVYAYTDGAGPAIKAESQISGNLIEAWHGPMFQDRKFYVDDDGNVYADGAYLNPASGFAEMLPGAEGLEAGDVLAVAPDGSLARCDAAYQPTVVGVYSPQAGYIGGAAEDQADSAGKVPLAVVGIVRVKVSAENGPISAGDLLVASATPGHAMRAGENPALGTVIGKALDSLDKDTGTILMLVMLR